VADVVKVTHEQVLERAKELYEEEGLIEFDEEPVLSKGDGRGAYVQAWVWVPIEDNEEIFP